MGRQRQAQLSAPQCRMQEAEHRVSCHAGNNLHGSYEGPRACVSKLTQCTSLCSGGGDLKAVLRSMNTVFPSCSGCNRHDWQAGLPLRILQHKPPLRSGSDQDKLAAGLIARPTQRTFVRGRTVRQVCPCHQKQHDSSACRRRQGRPGGGTHRQPVRRSHRPLGTKDLCERHDCKAGLPLPSEAT